jgi:hypothetical protein
MGAMVSPKAMGAKATVRRRSFGRRDLTRLSRKPNGRTSCPKRVYTAFKYLVDRWNMEPRAHEGYYQSPREEVLGRGVDFKTDLALEFGEYVHAFLTSTPEWVLVRKACTYSPNSSARSVLKSTPLCTLSWGSLFCHLVFLKALLNLFFQNFFFRPLPWPPFLNLYPGVADAIGSNTR